MCCVLCVVRASVRACVYWPRETTAKIVYPRSATPLLVLLWAVCVCVYVCARVCGRARKKTGSDGVCVGLKGPTSGAPNETRLLFDSISPSLQLPPRPPESRSQLARGEQNCIECVCVCLFFFFSGFLFR